MSGYLALACAALHPLLTTFSSRILADEVANRSGDSDAYNFLWTYWWIQRAALTDHHLYRCDWVLPPTGADLYFHTHVMLPTLATLPIARMLGTVSGYNAMILLLLAGAATVYYYFLRRTFSLGTAASFIAGALFGFCPYFVFKAHLHPNLIGGAFWGACLAVLLHGYLHGRFGWHRGVLFSLAFWATFWTSFVEFFALLVVVGLTVAVFELQYAIRRAARAPNSLRCARTADRTFGPRLASSLVPRLRCANLKYGRNSGVRAPDEEAQGRRHARIGRSVRTTSSLAQRLWFFAMTLPGAVSLVPLSRVPATDVVNIKLFPNLTLMDVVALPKVGMFGALANVSKPEYGGSHIPLVFLLLACLGLGLARRSLTTPSFMALLIVATTLLVLTFNPGNVPSAVLRRLPMGSGFRVFGRFLPFFFFFLLIVAAYGLERVLSVRLGLARAGSHALLAGLCFIELVPFRAETRPVRHFDVPESVRAESERGAFTWIVPRKHYTKELDTYQVSMDVPVVQLSYLAREDRAAKRQRNKLFPELYRPIEITPEVLRELQLAHVRYVLYEDARQYPGSRFPGEKIAENQGAILAALR